MLPMKKFGNKEVVDWKAISKGFEFTLNETRCEVVSNEMVSKVSRNGKTRKERRLTVRAIGSEATIEVSATSFKNMSFGKRLAKAMASEGQPKEEVDTEFRQRLNIEIDLLMAQAYSFKQSVKERAEEWMDVNFQNISLGHILFDSPEKRIAFVNSIMDDFKKDDIYGIVCANEWRTEYKAKFEAKIYNSWDRIWKRTQKEWEAFQEKIKGANWKDNWEQQNSRQAINGRDDIATKFDDEFKDCTDTKQVKRIYRKLAKTFHSDLGGDDQLMIELNKAYDKWLIKIGDGSKVAKTEEQAKQDAKEEDYKFWWGLWEELVDYDYDTFKRVMEYEAHPVYIA